MWDSIEYAGSIPAAATFNLVNKELIMANIPLGATAITLNEGTRLSREVRAMVDQLRDVNNRITKIHDALDARVVSGSFDYIEKEFGLEIGTGEAFYNLASGSYAAFQKSDILELLRRVS